MHQPPRFFIICLLGALSVISPFSIDMYLPAFGQVAHDLGVPTTTVSLTLSIYFIGMALGQIFYGPLLDRFGRKKPLLCGLSLYIVAALLCALAPDMRTLVACRFLQAVGGCVAGVASLAMVRDFFPPEDSAKILSRLFLFIAVSPLLAPTIGGAVAIAVGWKAVFFVLAVIVCLIMVLIFFLLPESHRPDTGISLKPLPILREYWSIFKNPRFTTYALAGAFSFAGLFTYVAGSPIVFMDGFHLSPTVYSGIFAFLAMGFIGASQFNVLLLKKQNSQQLFSRVLTLQVIVGIIFTAGTYLGWYGLPATLVLFFLFLSCSGITYPNAAATALAPFTRNIGSASALLGFLQLGVGSFISTGISIVPQKGPLSIIAIMGTTATIGFIVLVLGKKRAQVDSSHDL